MSDLEIARTHAPGGESRDWVQDFSHENGQYQCRCYACQRMFYGHKRRVECHDCATNIEKP